MERRNHTEGVIVAGHTLAPPRGTRPPNRRELILDAASDLFTRRGYEQVAMTDLAEAVGVGPSALYRHFAGKQDVLREVVSGGLAPLRNLVDDLDLADRARAPARLGWPQCASTNATSGRSGSAKRAT